MKKQINELYWIRAIACLSVVLIHSISRTYETYDLSESAVTAMQTTQMLIIFATPMFILLFEIIISNAYSDRIPDQFFQKRFLYLFLPYLSIPFLYGFQDIITKTSTITNAVDTAVTNILLGNWHGYFIIIILQFVIIHAIYVKKFKNVPAWLMLTVTFMINAAYLYGVNFRFDLFPEVMHIYYSLVRIPFLGWIFYFTVAYYVGKNLNVVRANRKWGFPLSVAATMISVYFLLKMFLSGTIMEVTSVRLDLMLYTISLFFFMYYLFSYIKEMPGFIMYISKYSFPIYLLHYLSFDFISPILPEMHPVLYGSILFLVGVFGSVFIAKIIYILPYSRFVVGRIKQAPKQKVECRERLREQTVN
jgi:membrane-bound acyltransferase YfiQ involved in biofilm formation